ncbi:MAG: helix-turn-helix domain-containing protein [Acutalibacteraceae bacterium]
MNGKRLKALLDEKGIHQAELAENVGVSQAFISYLIKGLKQPSLVLIKRIADYLHVPIDELV